MAQLVGSSIVQAVSSVGAQFLFSQFDHKNYRAEQHRHDLAVKKLTEARNKFFEDETLRKDKMARLELEKKKASSDFAYTTKLFVEQLQLQKEQEAAVEPKLTDYYEPSDEFKNYQFAATGLIGLASGATLAGPVELLLF